MANMLASSDLRVSSRTLYQAWQSIVSHKKCLATGSMQEWDGPTVYLMSVIYSKNFVSLILHLPLQHECFQQPQPLERVSQPQRYTFPCCLRASNAPKCANKVHRSNKAKNASNARRTLQQNLFNFEPREVS